MRRHRPDEPLGVDSIARESTSEADHRSVEGALSSAFYHFPGPFLEILRQPEVRREGEPLLRGVAAVGGPETGAASGTTSRIVLASYPFFAKRGASAARRILSRAPRALGVNARSLLAPEAGFSTSLPLRKVRTRSFFFASLDA